METPSLNLYHPRKEEQAKIKKMFSLVEKNNLHTICQEALCPNRFECFSHGVATFLILGNVCTRNCRFCYVQKGKPEEVDWEEPKKVAGAIKKLNLKYAVITCVTRDDLEDGGVEIFAKVVREIRKKSPECKVELLISDLQGNWQALEKIVKAEPDVLGHNLDTTKELYREIKPMNSYHRSLTVLKKIKKINPGMKTKSGLMLGLGEKMEEVVETMENLRDAEVDFFTLGQYLQPSETHAEVKKVYSSREFKKFEEIGREIGFEDVFSGPLVRSSYRADKLIKRL